MLTKQSVYAIFSALRMIGALKYYPFVFQDVIY